jgi:hypothetical protein
MTVKNVGMTTDVFEMEHPTMRCLPLSDVDHGAMLAKIGVNVIVVDLFADVTPVFVEESQ